MIIAKTDQKHIAFKAAKMGESVFAGQSDILISIPEVATAGLGRRILIFYILLLLGCPFTKYL